MSIALSVSDAGQRTWIRGALLEPQAAVGDSQRALSTARQIGQPWALGSVASGQAAASDIQGALSTARRIGDDFSRAKALSGIARAQILAEVWQANVTAARANVAAEQVKQAPAATQTASTGSGATSKVGGTTSTVARTQTGSGGGRASTGSGNENVSKRCQEAKTYYDRVTPPDVSKQKGVRKKHTEYTYQALQGKRFQDQSGCLTDEIRPGNNFCPQFRAFFNTCDYPMIYGTCLEKKDPHAVEANRKGANIPFVYCGPEPKPQGGEFTLLWPAGPEGRNGAEVGCSGDDFVYWAFTCEE